MKPQKAPNQTPTKGNPYMAFLWGILIVLVLNGLIFPKIAQQQIIATDYSSFIGKVDSGEHLLMTKEDLFNRIVTLTGGRAAEEIIFNAITTGASNDIEQATRLARAMVTRYGMSEKYDMMGLETVNNAYLGGDTSLTCSADTAADIDKEVLQLIRQAHEKARGILTRHTDIMHQAAAYLMSKETITGEEFMNIVRQCENKPQA